MVSDAMREIFRGRDVGCMTIYLVCSRENVSGQVHDILRWPADRLLTYEIIPPLSDVE